MDKHHEILTPTDDGASLHASGGWYARQLREWSCGHCHTCADRLTDVGHCPTCGVPRRYSCHGYIADDHDSTPCLTQFEREGRVRELAEYEALRKRIKG
jgi:hypothetical protein